MVLFKDDEEKMKKEAREEKLRNQTTFGKWMRRIFKVSMVLVGLFVFGLFILSSVGGSNDSLKNGIEDYLANATGLKAEIETLNNLEFVPVLRLNAENIAFSKEGKDGQVDQTLMVVGSVNFETEFFNILLSRQRFRTFEVKKFEVMPGVLGTDALILDEVVIKDEFIDDKPAMVATGNYGPHKLNAHVSMQKIFDGKVSYSMADDSVLKATYGDISLDATASKALGGGLLFKINSFAFPEKVMDGELLLKRAFSKMEVKSELSFGQSKLETDITSADGVFAGDITFPKLLLADIEILRKIQDAFYGLPGMKPGETINLFGKNLDLDIEVKELIAANDSLGSVNIDLKVADQVMNAGLKGKINGGKVDGKYTLKATSLPAELTATMDVKDWDYGLYQKAMFGRGKVEGKADIKMDLKSSGKTNSELLENLSGDAVLIAGEAEMLSAALNIWGAGLITAMMPNLSSDSMTTLNCMIAGFKIENGVAKADPLFMDTARVTVVGDGNIDLVKNRIDLKLEPKAKNPALLDVATAVNVSGPILNPKIGTDTFSLFEKLGGLALGLINPAFLAFSLTDLGLTDNHPCSEFIGDDVKANDNKKTEDKADRPVEPEQETTETFNE